VQTEDYEKVAGNVGYSMNVGPCHQGMAPHVADGGCDENTSSSGRDIPMKTTGG
jgi:hypothetical protein